MTAPAVITLEAGFYKENMFAGNGTDLCRLCGHPTRDHKMAPCPVFDLDVIVGQPLPKTPNMVTCFRTGCDEPVARRKDKTKGPKRYCSTICCKAHSARTLRGWGDDQDQAYQEAR